MHKKSCETVEIILCNSGSRDIHIIYVISHVVQALNI